MVTVLQQAVSQEWKTVVTGDLYKLCTEKAPEQFATTKTDTQWNEGLIGSSHDPYRPMRIGKLGEVAHTQLFDGSVNFTNYVKNKDPKKVHGDRYDFCFYGKTVDVKTSYGTKVQNFLLRYKEPKLKFDKTTNEQYLDWDFLPIRNDIYVSCSVVEDSLEQNYAVVVFHGYVLWKDVAFSAKAWGYKRSVSHVNHAIPFSSLRPMEQYDKFVKTGVMDFNVLPLLPARKYPVCTCNVGSSRQPIDGCPAFQNFKIY